MQGAINTAASLLLRLLDGGNAAAFAAINDCIIETGNIETAIKLACELFSALSMYSASSGLSWGPE